MLMLTKEEIQKFYSLSDCIEAVTSAFQLFADHKIQVPLRSQIVTDNNTDSFLCMPAYCEAAHASCVKVLNVFPNNPAKGLPSINAQVLTMNTTTGLIEGILDGNYVTQLRTGAATGVAIKLLARSNCHKGALIGTGGQAATQLEAMLIARPLAEVQVFDRDQQRATQFVAQMQQVLERYHTTISTAPTANDAVTDADIIVTVTSASSPVYDGELVKKGATVCGVGSYQPQMQETPATLVAKADKIYFDSQEAVLAEAGDVLVPLNAGQISTANFTGDIGAVFNGSLSGRQNDEEIIFFKTVGIAAQDLITSKSIYDQAVQQGYGVAISS